MIRGITFSEQVFYSADFAHYMNFFLNGGVGITKGCNITNDGTKVTIGTGYFVAHGRLMNVEAAETIEATQGFETGYNRIVYEIDLSKENTILDFRQGSIRVLPSEALTQEDLDAEGMIYQFPLCHFQWSGAAITGFVVDAPTLVLDDIMAQWSDNYTAINQQFDVWFSQQKNGFTSQMQQQIEDTGAWAQKQIDDTEAWVQHRKDTVNNLVASLESRGFEKKAVYVETTMLASGWNVESKTYSFEAAYPSSEYNISIQPNYNCTEEQLDAYGEARPLGRIGMNVVTAGGEVPKVDIPIIVKIVRTGAEPTAEALAIGDTDTGYYVEIDGEDKNIQNIVDSDNKLTDNNYSLEIL